MSSRGCSDGNPCWVSRRQWVTQQLLGLVVFGSRRPLIAAGRAWDSGARSSGDRLTRAALQCARLEPESWEQLAERAVDAARSAGASYADARLTRVVQHVYRGNGNVAPAYLSTDAELIGVGVRTLVNGSWGFSASVAATPEEVVRLAQDAVGQARENGKRGGRRPVELGSAQVATGRWATPVRIDPFTVPLEEKIDFFEHWKATAIRSGVPFVQYGETSWLMFVRREQVVATSDGALFTQTRYESGGDLEVFLPPKTAQDIVAGSGGPSVSVHGVAVTGAGWELFLDAKIPEQFLSGRLYDEVTRLASIPSRPAAVGKYTLVCDGVTMAALVEATLGAATQLDRALGYEANAGGTGWLADPLEQVGTVSLTSPLVTLTANRSAPGALGTVRWDTEGVEAPAAFPLIRDGVLVDFQTTREQAAWLTPYYTKRGLPIRSHGCAETESGHLLPLQQLPNLTLEPGLGVAQLTDLAADVPDGILVERGDVLQMDAQARTGILQGKSMRQIKNGRVGAQLTSGVVLFDSQQLWNSVKALGGPATAAWLGYTPEVSFQNDFLGGGGGSGSLGRYARNQKGEPGQSTSHSVQAVAAVIANQPIIDYSRQA